jgi:hypothetical protein
MAAGVARPSLWYRTISVFAVLWMIFGVMAWLMDLRTDQASLDAMTEPQRRLSASRPGWMLFIYGTAVLSGLAGSIGLLLRRAWAVPALALSFAAIVIQFGYTFLVMDAAGLLGPAQALPLPLMIIGIGAFLLWFGWDARKRGMIV